MRTFPIMLKLTDRQAVVVGAGAVAMRKTRALRDAGARVRLIAPAPPEDVGQGVEIVAETYQPTHLAGATIVFACTDDHDLNAKIAKHAQQIGALACAVDQPEDGDFFSPAVVREGDVIVAVGTGGSAPGLAKSLARILGEALPERIGDFATCLAELRRELQNTLPESRQRHTIFRSLTNEETYRAFLADGPEGVRRRLDHLRQNNNNALHGFHGSKTDSTDNV